MDRGRPTDRSNVEGLEHGVNRDVLAVLDGRLQINRLGAEHDEFHFGMRDAAQLDQVSRRKAICGLSWVSPGRVRCTDHSD
jgi:hypothetical protein